MQKHGNKPNAIEEAYLLEAKTDENFIILPDFGFTNINAKKTDLLFSNWINIGVENQYDFIKEFKGLAKTEKWCLKKMKITRIFPSLSG